jgi:GrpB-like predicted nucleotidyltransferase (UPF0157 family)
MSDPITVLSYDPIWPEIFRQLGVQLGAALGGVALRIDHIGSTAVPGLAAKPIMDVQISMEQLEPVEPIQSPLEAAGFVFWAANTECTKRYFREPPGQRRTHVHMRQAGSFSEQFALLFRDFVRADPAAAQAHGRRKVVLAARSTYDRHGYLDAKIPISWDVLRRADQWAQETGWEPGPSDA